MEKNFLFRLITFLRVLVFSAKTQWNRRYGGDLKQQCLGSYTDVYPKISVSGNGWIYIYMLVYQCNSEE